MIFAYFGPETVLPLASILATVFGVVMMFGRLSFKMMLAPFRALGRSKRVASDDSTLRGPTAWRRGAKPTHQDPVMAETREEA